MDRLLPYPRRVKTTHSQIKTARALGLGTASSPELICLERGPLSSLYFTLHTKPLCIFALRRLYQLSFEETDRLMRLCKWNQKNQHIFLKHSTNSIEAQSCRLQFNK